MRSLDQADQQRHSDRTQTGNLPQKLMGWMLFAFGQQLSPRFSTDLSQTIELLIEPLSAPAHARFG